MPLSVPCFRKDKIEKSDGQALPYQAKSEATKAPNYQIGDRMSPVPSDFSILSLRKLGKTAGIRNHRKTSCPTPHPAAQRGGRSPYRLVSCKLIHLIMQQFMFFSFQYALISRLNDRILV